MSTEEQPKDGGQEFPFDPQGIQPHPGMSLRDWFAGLALQGELASEATYSFKWTNDKGEARHLCHGSNPEEDGTNWRRVATPTEQLCQQCYTYADAMLAARERRAE